MFIIAVLYVISEHLYCQCFHECCCAYMLACCILDVRRTPNIMILNNPSSIEFFFREIVFWIPIHVPVIFSYFNDALKLTLAFL